MPTQDGLAHWPTVNHWTFPIVHTVHRVSKAGSHRPAGKRGTPGALPKEVMQQKDSGSSSSVPETGMWITSKTSSQMTALVFGRLGCCSEHRFGTNAFAGCWLGRSIPRVSFNNMLSLRIAGTSSPLLCLHFGADPAGSHPLHPRTHPRLGQPPSGRRPCSNKARRRASCMPGREGQGMPVPTRQLLLSPVGGLQVAFRFHLRPLHRGRRQLGKHICRRDIRIPETARKVLRFRDEDRNVTQTQEQYTVCLLMYASAPVCFVCVCA